MENTDESESVTGMIVAFDGNVGADIVEVMPREVILGESLLTPGLQTSVKVHSYIHNIVGGQVKNFDKFKSLNLIITLNRPINKTYGVQSSLNIRQKIYRVDERHLINNSTEEFNIKACDQTQLNDAETLVSKSWKCTTPSEIVRYVLPTCAGAEDYIIQDSNPARDYIAENIHPFQVVGQQASYALDPDGDDPSYVHFMTYADESNNFSGGIHHFESIKRMAKQEPVMRFVFNESDKAYIDPRSILTYSFPCDFDLLSDILNGVNSSGRDINSLAIFNPVSKTFSLLGNDSIGCGIGSGVIKAAISNQNTAQQQDSCPDYAKEYMLKRQARMGLLEKDKIALRIVVPFNPGLHAGKTIEANFMNKESENMPLLNYGSGKYLILHMFHHILAGGMATTILDCVSSTVGERGEV